MEQPQNQQNRQELATISSSRKLLNILTKGDKLAISLHLAKFKERNQIQFPKLFEISISDRIPELAKTEKGRSEVFIAILASVKSLFSNINLRVGLNEDQMIEIADQIIEQAGEDNLALEDFLLFGQKFLVGEYGKIYDRMDVPTFFEFFEKYRQLRHEAILNVREEEHAQFKSMGRGPDPQNSVELDRNQDAQSMLDLMQTFYSKE